MINKLLKNCSQNRASLSRSNTRMTSQTIQQKPPQLTSLPGEKLQRRKTQEYNGFYQSNNDKTNVKGIQQQQQPTNIQKTGHQKYNLQPGNSVEELKNQLMLVLKELNSLSDVSNKTMDENAQLRKLLLKHKHLIQKGEGKDGKAVKQPAEEQYKLFGDETNNDLISQSFFVPQLSIIQQEQLQEENNCLKRENEKQEKEKNMWRQKFQEAQLQLQEQQKGTKHLILQSQQKETFQLKKQFLCENGNILNGLQKDQAFAVNGEQKENKKHTILPGNKGINPSINKEEVIKEIILIREEKEKMEKHYLKKLEEVEEQNLFLVEENNQLKLQSFEQQESLQNSKKKKKGYYQELNDYFQQNLEGYNNKHSTSSINCEVILSKNSSILNSAKPSSFNQQINSPINKNLNHLFQ